MIPEPQIRSKRLSVGEDGRPAGWTDRRLTAAESSADRRLEAPHTNGLPAASLPFGFFPPIVCICLADVVSVGKAPAVV